MIFFVFGRDNIHILVFSSQPRLPWRDLTSYQLQVHMNLFSFFALYVSVNMFSWGGTVYVADRAQCTRGLKFLQPLTEIAGVEELLQPLPFSALFSHDSRLDR